MNLSQSLRSLFAANVALAAVACGAPASAANLTLPAGATISAGGNGLVLSSSCSSYVVSGTSLNCSNSGGTPPPSGPTCTLLAPSVTQLPSTGGSLTLTATCDATTDTYVWSGPGNLSQTTTVAGNGAPGPNGANTLVIQGAVPGTYTVTPSASGVQGTSTQVTVTATGSTGGTPPGTIDCSALGYTSTKVIEAAFPDNGGHQNQYFTSAYGNLSPKTAMVLHFKAPASDAYFAISMTTDTSNAKDTVKNVVLSHSTTCDFAPQQNLSSAKAVAVSISLSSSQTATPGASKNVLKGGDDYYLYVGNIINGAQQCPYSQCNLLFTFDNPTP